MFDDIVERYDLLNGVLSFGLDRFWRRTAALAIRRRPAGPVLDLGCGTGELGLEVVRSGEKEKRPEGAGARLVVGVDISQRMLLAARQRAGDKMTLVRGSAFRLPFHDGALAAIVSGFVLRNLHDLTGAFGELARTSMTGAPIALVDITEPRQPMLRRAFDAYFSVAARALGSLVGKRDAYRYLSRSLAQLPEPEQVCAMLEAAGFRHASARGLSGGMVTLFSAIK